LPSSKTVVTRILAKLGLDDITDIFEPDETDQLKAEEANNQKLQIAALVKENDDLKKQLLGAGVNVPEDKPKKKRNRNKSA